MPPISRLEDQAQMRRCLRLRRTVSECLYTMLERYILSQHALQPLTDDINLAKYHDIYDISLEELAEAESSLNERETDDQYSLRALRTLFGRLYVVRKSILCCLLALGADGGGSDITRWSTAVEQMRDLTDVTGINTRRMASILNEEDRECIASLLIIMIPANFAKAMLSLLLLYPQRLPTGMSSSRNIEDSILFRKASVLYTQKCT